MAVYTVSIELGYRLYFIHCSNHFAAKPNKPVFFIFSIVIIIINSHLTQLLT